MESFKQYEFCELCKRNHQNGAKHVYQKQHRDKVLRRISALSAQVTEAKSSLLNQAELSRRLDVAEKVWCSVCQVEYSRDARLSARYVKYLGVIAHVSSPEHKSCVFQFCREQRVSGEQSHGTMIADEEYQSIYKRISECLLDHECEEASRVQEEATKIRQSELRKSSILYWASKQSAEVEAASSSPSGRTVSPVDKPLPPWLMDDDSVPTTIGPTLEDLEKHKRTCRLPAQRVGHDFHQNLSTYSSSWLPSFGRLWGNGRRKPSRNNFRRERGNMNKTERCQGDGHSRGAVDEPPGTKP